jgi:hypothetical protein
MPLSVYGEPDFKTKVNGRNIYYTDVPVSKSLSARLGIGPNGSIVKRVKDPHIDMENDMVYLGIN